MKDLNAVFLMGRVVRDIDEKNFGYISNGTARLNISLAVNRSVKKGDEWTDEASFFDVTVWGKTAENIKAYIHKGTKLLVDGSLIQDRWEKDGQKFTKVSVVANAVTLCGGSKESAGFVKKDEAPEPEANYQEDIPF